MSNKAEVQIGTKSFNSDWPNRVIHDIEYTDVKINGVEVTDVIDINLNRSTQDMTKRKSTMTITFVVDDVTWKRVESDNQNSM